MSQRQSVLAGLKLSPQDAIQLAHLPPRIHGVKAVSTAMQKRVLQFIAAFSSDECWVSIVDIAKQLNHTERTIRLTLKVLENEELIFVRGPKNRRVRTVHWTKIGLLVPRMRTDSEPVKLANATGARVSCGPVEDVPTDRLECSYGPVQPVRRDRTINKEQKETTTTVVVEVSECGVTRSADAVRLARARGLSDAEIRELCQRWRERPEQPRAPGILYNWLTIPNSFRELRGTGSVSAACRGDGLTKKQVEAEALRKRIFDAGRAAGASPEQIEAKLQEAGV